MLTCNECGSSSLKPVRNLEDVGFVDLGITAVLWMFRHRCLNCNVIDSYLNDHELNVGVMHSYRINNLYIKTTLLYIE